MPTSKPGTNLAAGEKRSEFSRPTLGGVGSEFFCAFRCSETPTTLQYQTAVTILKDVLDVGIPVNHGLPFFDDESPSISHGSLLYGSASRWRTP